MTSAPQIPRYTLRRGLRSFFIGSLLGLLLMLMFSSASIPFVGTAWRQADAAEDAFKADAGRDRAADCRAANTVARAWQEAGYPKKHETWLQRADGLCNTPALPD